MINVLLNAAIPTKDFHYGKEINQLYMYIPFVS